MLDVWRAMGMNAGEGFADRRYERMALRSRKFPDALITDPAAARTGIALRARGQA